MKTRCQHYRTDYGCVNPDYDCRKQKQTICPPDATESCFIRNPKKPKQVFIWSRYTREEVDKVDAAIIAVINKGRKACVTVQEVG